MWIVVVVGMIISMLTLLIHCFKKSKKTCTPQNKPCANSKQCCDDLYCSTHYGCVSCIQEKDTCTTQAECCEGLHCNGSSGTCEKCEGTTGNSCLGGTSCCLPLKCVGGKCIDCINLGDDCSGGKPCCSDLKCNSENKCSDCKVIGNNCTENEECCDGVCNNYVCTKCPSNCAVDKDCCSGQYCGGVTCTNCAKINEYCGNSNECCGDTTLCYNFVCTTPQEFTSMGAFLIVNKENTQSVSEDIKWVDGSTTWETSTANFWFWSLIQGDEKGLYLGVEVKDVSNFGTRYYVAEPELGNLTLLNKGNVPQAKSIRLNLDGTITNTNQALFLTHDLTWSSSKSDCYKFTIVVPTSGSEIGGTCLNDVDCALPYRSCTEGKCVACYEAGRQNCNTSFLNRCNIKNPNRFNWECVVPNKICGTPTTRCNPEEIQSCNTVTRMWECLNQPSGQCPVLPTDFLCGPPDKFQPMCNPNTNNNWICQSICTVKPDITCDTGSVPICYSDETTGLYKWHCVPGTIDDCDLVPFSPNCLQTDNFQFYDSDNHCLRKCKYEMTKNDLLNSFTQGGSGIDLVQNIPVV